MRAILMAPGKHKVIPPSHLVPSRPREAEGILRRQGLEIARKSNPSQDPKSHTRSGVSHSLAQKNNEGLMNSAILLVDVASAGRDSWKSFLRSQNYEVFTAEDGESAVRQCVQFQPDLVLLYDTLPDV